MLRTPATSLPGILAPCASNLARPGRRRVGGDAERETRDCGNEKPAIRPPIERRSPAEDLRLRSVVIDNSARSRSEKTAATKLAAANASRIEATTMGGQKSRRCTTHAALHGKAEREFHIRPLSVRSAAPASQRAQQPPHFQSPPAHRALQRRSEEAELVALRDGLCHVPRSDLSEHASPLDHDRASAHAS
jgi:hypothetical protein